jgi:hypothetical protein
MLYGCPRCLFRGLLIQNFLYALRTAKVRGLNSRAVCHRPESTAVHQLRQFGSRANGNWQSAVDFESWMPSNCTNAEWHFDRPDNLADPHPAKSRCELNSVTKSGSGSDSECGCRIRIQFRIRLRILFKISLPVPNPDPHWIRFQSGYGSVCVFLGDSDFWNLIRNRAPDPDDYY